MSDPKNPLSRLCTWCRIGDDGRSKTDLLRRLDGAEMNFSDPAGDLLRAGPGVVAIPAL